MVDMIVQKGLTKQATYRPGLELGCREEMDHTGPDGAFE